MCRSHRQCCGCRPRRRHAPVCPSSTSLVVLSWRRVFSSPSFCGIDDAVCHIVVPPGAVVRVRGGNCSSGQYEIAFSFDDVLTPVPDRHHRRPTRLRWYRKRYLGCCLHRPRMWGVSFMELAVVVARFFFIMSLSSSLFLWTDSSVYSCYRMCCHPHSRHRHRAWTS